MKPISTYPIFATIFFAASCAPQIVSDPPSVPASLGCSALTGASQEHHDLITSGDYTQEQEIDLGSCSTGRYSTRASCDAGSGTWTPAILPVSYRDVPDIMKDDEGLNGSVTFVDRTAWGTTTCGTSGTIAARISDCATNATIGSGATWDGSKLGNAGLGAWKLVTRAGNGEEVWQDQRTFLLWSSLVSNGDNWCHADGNVQAGDPSNYCNNNTYQNQTTPVSYCAEDTGLSPAIAGENWSSGTYDAHKGGMGKNSSTAVLWRLPTKYDYQQADNDGVRFVLPDMGASGNWEWAATILATARQNAWIFFGNDGYVNTVDRANNTGLVRCVGR